MSQLFTPLQLGPLELANRIVVSHASEKLGASILYPLQYARAQRSVWPAAEIIRPIKK